MTLPESAVTGDRFSSPELDTDAYLPPWLVTITNLSGSTCIMPSFLPEGGPVDSAVLYRAVRVVSELDMADVGDYDDDPAFWEAVLQPPCTHP